jgi:hypothetical protein
MCSLGALYCFEKETAHKIHVVAMGLLRLATEGRNALELRDKTWVCQTMVLGLLYAAFSGDVAFFRRSLLVHGTLSNVPPCKNARMNMDLL